MFFRNHFKNLCFHEKDFEFKVKSYNFFASGHGKNACDGIGATVKVATRRASLQRPLTGQIQYPTEMYDYCK